MTIHSAEEISTGKIESFYLFFDTNLFYSPKVTYSIFKTKLMEDILNLRNSFNEVFAGYRNIKVLIPKLVVDEIYSIKANIIKSEISNFQEKVKHLEEEKLKNSLENIKRTAHFELCLYGQNFFSNYGVEIVPYCNNEYLPTIIEKSINKELPFKPKFDEKKNCHVGDNGFKDTVIWFSIIDYVKGNCNKNADHIFFLTNNNKDFLSEQTLFEFKELTGMDIEIIDFKNNNPNVGNSEFTPFLNYILDKSYISSPIKINRINISYLELKNKAEINSIFIEPISININSVVNCKKKFSNMGDKNKLLLNAKIKETLSKFRFDVSDIEFNYYIPEIESAYFDLVNNYNESLCIYDIGITYKDGCEKWLSDSLDVYTNLDPYYPIEFEENSEEFKSLAFKILCDYLEKEGYGSVNPEAIDFEYNYMDY